MSPLTFLGLVAGAALLPVVCDKAIDWWSRAVKHLRRTNRFIDAAVDDARVPLRIDDESREGIAYLDARFEMDWAARQPRLKTWEKP